MIRTLHRWQVQDPRKGSFLVKVEKTRDKYRGRWVYVASKGTPHEMRFVVLD